MPEGAEEGGGPSHVKVPLPSPYPLVIVAAVCFALDVVVGAVGWAERIHLVALGLMFFALADLLKRNRP
jgi:predicted tellurium resistance membrane protein TerC